MHQNSPGDLTVTVIIYISIIETLLFLVCSQLGCNVVLLLVANLIGMYHKYLTDVTHRHTFLEARKSIKSMVELEQEKKEQVSHDIVFFSFV